MNVSDEIRKWCDKIDHKREGFWNLRATADSIERGARDGRA